MAEVSKLRKREYEDKWIWISSDLVKVIYDMATTIWFLVDFYKNLYVLIRSNVRIKERVVLRDKVFCVRE
jgi:hypothetical protein